MMRLKTATSTALLAGLAMLGTPFVVMGADAPAASAPVTVTATRTIGAETLTLTGVAPAGHALSIVTYARFTRDVPNVLLCRRSVSPDADGHYSTTVPTASAFFRGAVVTVVVTSLPAGPSARASLNVEAPNEPAPPDDIPASVR